MNPDDQAREWEQVPIVEPPPDPAPRRRHRKPTPNWLKAWYALMALVAFLVLISEVFPHR